MTISLGQLLALKYPTDMAARNILVQDDGQGAYIAKWNVEGVTQPDQAALEALQDDPDVVKAQKDIINQPIMDQLDALDLKSIRAIRENDQTRIQQYVTQAAALRAQLV